MQTKRKMNNPLNFTVYNVCYSIGEVIKDGNKVNHCYINVFQILKMFTVKFTSKQQLVDRANCSYSL